MILLDVSSAFHQTVHRLVKSLGTPDQFFDFKEHRPEFHKSLLWTLDTHQHLFNNYGDLVICIDDKTLPSWRKSYYPNYKSQRKKFTESFTNFDYKDAYEVFEDFLKAIKVSGLKSIGVPEAEADDIILVLGEFFAAKEPVMILSPDKDFIQLQKSPNVSQYSWSTQQMITPDTKSGNLNDWIIEHICLGDAVDAVPKIVDFQEFKPGIKEMLFEKYQFEGTPLEFSFTKWMNDFEKNELYQTVRFGPAAIQKAIQKHGDFKSFINSSEHLKESFKRNHTLVMSQGIPDRIRERILTDFSQIKPKYDIDEFVEILGIEKKEVPDFLLPKVNYLDF